MEGESNRIGIISISAIYWMCELDKLFIILEISFSYLWDRNNDTHTGGLFQEFNNEHISTSVQFSSVTQSCPTLCNPMDCSIPGLPVYHQLPEFTQIHGHWVGDAIQPSNPLLVPSPPSLNLSQHQGFFFFQMSQFFTSAGQRIGVSASASVLPMNIQDWFPLGWTGWISLQSKRLSRVFSNTTVQ